MVSVNDLKKIHLLQNLPDHCYEKMVSFVRSETRTEKDTLFEEGQKADDFFMLAKGLVLLKVKPSEKLTISLGSIKPGYSFGWSSLIPGRLYTSSAVCAEECDLLIISGEKFLALFEEDHYMGYKVMSGVVRILNNRLERRTRQFKKTLERHIDLESILE